MRVLITGGSGFIGTNLVSAYLSNGGNVELLNLDRKAPFIPAHAKFWRQHDFLDAAATLSVVREFQPQVVIHLAARADCDEDTTLEKGYPDNTVAVSNLLAAVRQTSSIRRLVVTSTQYVFRPAGARMPADDLDYDPHTIYGQSKVITEELTRSAALDCSWLIIRPTTVWGPWCLRYKEGFLKVLKRGLYFHPNVRECVRSYGYVGNVCWQIQELVKRPDSDVHAQAWYVGDRPAALERWVNAFSQALTGKNVKKCPLPLMQMLARYGDLHLRLFGKRFLMDTTRLGSMIEDYMTPMEKTFRLLGEAPYSLDEGVKATVDWVNS